MATSNAPRVQPVPQAAAPANGAAMAALFAAGIGSLAIGLFTLDIGLRPDDRFPFWLVVPGIVALTGSIAFVLYLVVAGPEALAPPIERPDILLITTLEWLTLIGILFWVGIIATRWRLALARAGRVQ